MLLSIVTVTVPTMDSIDRFSADVEGQPLRSLVSSINLVQLNRSISDQYCDQCSGLNVNYRLPLHPRFPLVPVTIQFEYVYVLHVFPERGRLVS